MVGQDLRCFMPGFSLGPPPLLTPDPRTAKASASAVGLSLASPGRSRLPNAMLWECFPSPCPTSPPPCSGGPSRVTLPSLWLPNPTLTAALAATLSSWVSTTEHLVLSLCRSVHLVLSAWAADGKGRVGSVGV